MELKQKKAMLQKIQMKFKVILFFIANAVIAKNPNIHIQLSLYPEQYPDIVKKNKSADHNDNIRLNKHDLT